MNLVLISADINQEIERLHLASKVLSTLLKVFLLFN